MLFLVLFSCVGCDQSTKFIAKNQLADAGSLEFFDGVLKLIYSENTGAFLGLGASLPLNVRTVIFSVLVGVFLFAFLLYLLKSKSITNMGILAGGLILGGGISNLLDRLYNNGAVIDFLNVGIGSLRTGIFNVADMTIMLGALLFLLSSRNKRITKNSNQPPSASV